MAYPVRLSMLCNLTKNDEMNVTDIVEAEMGAVSQSHASQFLARMREDGLVSTRNPCKTGIQTRTLNHLRMFRNKKLAEREGLLCSATAGRFFSASWLGRRLGTDCR